MQLQRRDKRDRAKIIWKKENMEMDWIDTITFEKPGIPEGWKVGKSHEEDPALWKDTKHERQRKAARRKEKWSLEFFKMEWEVITHPLHQAVFMKDGLPALWKMTRLERQRNAGHVKMKWSQSYYRMDWEDVQQTGDKKYGIPEGWKIKKEKVDLEEITRGSGLISGMSGRKRKRNKKGKWVKPKEGLEREDEDLPKGWKSKGRNRNDKLRFWKRARRRMTDTPNITIDQEQIQMEDISIPPEDLCCPVGLDNGYAGQKNAFQMEISRLEEYDRATVDITGHTVTVPAQVTTAMQCTDSTSVLCGSTTLCLDTEPSDMITHYDVQTMPEQGPEPILRQMCIIPGDKLGWVTEGGKTTTFSPRVHKRGRRRIIPDGRVQQLISKFTIGGKSLEKSKDGVVGGGNPHY